MQKNLTMKELPDLERPYKYGSTRYLSSSQSSSLWLMINNLMEDPVTALTGLIVPVIGIFFYLYFKKKYGGEEKEHA